MGEMTSKTETAPVQRLTFRAAGLTNKEATSGATAYTAEAEGVTYRVVGSIIPGRMDGRRSFRAYRVVGTNGHSLHAAGSGGEHKTRAAAFEQAEADLAEVLRDRAAAEITFPTPICPDTEAGTPHAAHRIEGTWREQCNGVPDPQAAPCPSRPDPALDDNVLELVDRVVRRAQYEALKTVRSVLAGWVEGAESNCRAMDHGSASRHDDNLLCGERFDREDVARMINDAADALHVPKVVEQ